MAAALGPAPVEIGRSGAHDVRVVWGDGHVSVYAARTLRLACPCAACVDELSGARMLNPDTVAADVHPLRIGTVGRYAVHIAFSDGHASGIYSFEKLRALCPCGECARA